MSPNEKAAWWRPSNFNAVAFRNQFLIYGVFVTTLGLLRTLLGQMKGLMGFLAWEAVYLPLVAVLALVLACRKED
jgi:hypothetical protein